MTASGLLSVALPAIAKPSALRGAGQEAFRSSFAVMVPGGALLRAEPEWDENACFESEPFAHLDSSGTAQFAGVYLEFAGPSSGEAIECCQCWGDTCSCTGGDTLGPAITATVEEICPGKAAEERCMYCISREYAGRRCGLALSWTGL